MPLKRNKISKTGLEPIADAMAGYVFPDDIMLCILTRLPVKSILRFKSVCKPWRELFSTPGFKKMHQVQFSSDPNKQSFIGDSIDEYHCMNTLSHFDIESNEKELTIIYISARFVVGCCNGLACLSDHEEIIVLWNPALKLSKTVSSPLKARGVRERVSLGFGYDAEAGDYKVVKIVYVSKEVEVEEDEEGDMKMDRIEVYSVNSDSWTPIDSPSFQFSLLSPQNDAIVNGNPYWLAQVNWNESSESAESDTGEILVCFDVKKLVFWILPLSSLAVDVNARFVDWNGSVAYLVCSENDKRGVYVDVWVFDDGDQIWRRNHSFGPIEVDVDRVLNCSKNGKLVVADSYNEMFVFDPETGRVKELFYGAQEHEVLKIYGYTESFAYIKGMKNDDDNDDDDDDYDARPKSYKGLLVSNRM